MFFKFISVSTTDSTFPETSYRASSGCFSRRPFKRDGRMDANCQHFLYRICLWFVTTVGQKRMMHGHFWTTNKSATLFLIAHFALWQQVPSIHCLFAYPVGIGLRGEIHSELMTCQSQRTWRHTTIRTHAYGQCRDFHEPNMCFWWFIVSYNATGVPYLPCLSGLQDGPWW